MERKIFRTSPFSSAFFFLMVLKMRIFYQCKFLLSYYTKNLRFFAFLSFALVCYASCVCCKSYASKERGLFANVFLGVEDGHFDSNSNHESINIDQLINLNRIVFKELLNDDLERGDGQFVVKHHISHRAGTGPFRMEIDPKNARLLNDTAKKILTQMMAILAATSVSVSAEINASRVEKSCSKICRNGGACLVSNDTDACFCLTGFRGEFCEFLDDCNRAPGCGSSASCINDGGHLRCRCQDGYYLSEKGCRAGGKCREVTCQNGGTCLPRQLSEKLNSPKEFSCRCKLGFRGQFCEEVIPECDDNPCNPDEVCIATPTGSYCRSQKAVVRHRHNSLKLSRMSLLWLLVPLASFILAPIVVSKILQWRRFREKKREKTDTKVRNNRLKDGKVWFQSSPGKSRHADQHALLRDFFSEDDDKIQDGVGQIV